MKNIIYEDDCITVIFNNLNSDILIVTFGDMVNLANEDLFFAEKPLRKLNLSCLSFMAKKPNWFPQKSMVNSFLITNKITNSYKKIIGYSGSMGAYALIKYSKNLKLNKAILLVPQYSINRNDIIDLRYNKYFDKNNNHNMKIEEKDLNLDCKYLFIYDKFYNKDKIHVDKILENFKNKSQYRIIYLNHTEHHATSILASTGLLSCFIRYEINDPIIIKNIRKTKRESLFYLNYFFKKITKKSHFKIFLSNNLEIHLNDEAKKIFFNKLITFNIKTHDKNKKYLLTCHKKILCYNFFSNAIESFDYDVVKNWSGTIFPIIPINGNLCIQFNNIFLYLHLKNEKLEISYNTLSAGSIKIIETKEKDFLIQNDNELYLTSELNNLSTFRTKIAKNWEKYKIWTPMD